MTTEHQKGASSHATGSKREKSMQAVGKEAMSESTEAWLSHVEDGFDTGHAAASPKAPFSLTARLRLRGQVLFTLVAVLSTALLVTFFVVRGLNRSAHMQDGLLQMSSLTASFAQNLPDSEQARDRFVDEVGSHPSVASVLLVDERLGVLAPIGEAPFWTSDQAPGLVTMMREGRPAYHSPEGDSGDLWILTPLPKVAHPRDGGIRALGIRFVDQGMSPERLASEKLLLLFLLLIVGMMAIVGYLALTKLAIRPVRRLIHKVDRVGGPELSDIQDASWPGHGNELTVLDSAVDRMLSRLSSHKKRIDESLERQKELNQRLLHAREALVRSEKLASVGQLAAGVAHEIGNPVSIILGYLEILRRSDVSEEERKNYLDDVTLATERISVIIRDLLDFSRPPQDDDCCTDLDRIIVLTSKLLAPQKRFRNVELVVPEGPTGLHVHFNEGRLQQVLVNLLMNAADAMDEQGRVEISVREGEHRVCLEVVDGGPGIPLSEQRRVFDPFYTTKEPGEGTGLGLPICYSLVNTFGGDISVESSSGDGTTFRIELWKAGHQPENENPPTEAELLDLLEKKDA